MLHTHRLVSSKWYFPRWAQAVSTERHFDVCRVKRTTLGKKGRCQVIGVVAVLPTVKKCGELARVSSGVTLATGHCTLFTWGF